MSAKSDLVGSAGLFSAAFELAQREWLVSPTFGSAIRTDLLAQHVGTQRTAAIQVKTRTSGDFHLDVSDPSPPDADEWVILVSLGGLGERPGFCVVPRNHVCTLVRVLGAILSSQHRPWPRKLIGEREFERYRDAWDLMEAPPRDAEWRLPQWVFDGLAEHPQPELAPPAGPMPSR
jgi:hypothetical protein